MSTYFTRPVLYGNRQYWPGDKVPEGASKGLRDAWVSVGSARTDPVKKRAAAKAKRAAAQPGITGRSSDGSPKALAGKIPDEPV